MLEIGSSGTNTHNTGISETKIVKVSYDPPLVNGENRKLVNTWLQNIHELIHPAMNFGNSHQLSIDVGMVKLRHDCFGTSQK